MVKHSWIERKLIYYERDKSSNIWDQKKEKQLKYLLMIYHTGKFNSLTTSHIATALKGSNQNH